MGNNKSRPPGVGSLRQDFIVARNQCNSRSSGSVLSIERHVTTFQNSTLKDLVLPWTHALGMTEECEAFSFFMTMAMILITLFIGIFSFFGHVRWLNWLLESPLIRQIHMPLGRGRVFSMPH